jgi:hypothetical protein
MFYRQMEAKISAEGWVPFGVFMMTSFSAVLATWHMSVARRITCYMWLDVLQNVVLSAIYIYIYRL